MESSEEDELSDDEEEKYGGYSNRDEQRAAKRKAKQALKASGTPGAVLFRKLMTDIAHQAARAR